MYDIIGNYYKESYFGSWILISLEHMEKLIDIYKKDGQSHLLLLAVNFGKVYPGLSSNIFVHRRTLDCQKAYYDTSARTVVFSQQFNYDDVKNFISSEYSGIRCDIPELVRIMKN
jgi:hypothetical protein